MFSEAPARKHFSVVDVRQDLLRVVLAALASRMDDDSFSREETAVIVRFFRAENLDPSLDKHGGTPDVEEYMNAVVEHRRAGNSQKSYAEEWLRDLCKRTSSQSPQLQSAVSLSAEQVVQYEKMCVRAFWNMQGLIRKTDRVTQLYNQIMGLSNMLYEPFRIAMFIRALWMQDEFCNNLWLLADGSDVSAPASDDLGSPKTQADVDNDLVKNNKSTKGQLQLIGSQGEVVVASLASPETASRGTWNADQQCRSCKNCIIT